MLFRSFGFDGSSTLGYQRPQLLSPPRSKESSPTSSGTASPRISPKNSREGSPDLQSKSLLGLQVPLSGSPRPMSPRNDDKLLQSPVAALSSGSPLGFSVPGANARVDTSDPSYAALLRQWCFAQSSPPPPTLG